MKKQEKHFYNIMLFIIILCTIIFAFWSLDGILFCKPMSKLDKIELEKEKYQPGDLVYGKVTYCKNRAMKATLQVNVVDTFS